MRLGVDMMCRNSDYAPALLPNRGLTSLWVSLGDRSLYLTASRVGNLEEVEGLFERPLLFREEQSMR